MKAILFDLDETLLDRSGSLVDFLRWQAYGQLESSLENKEKYIARFIELDDNGALWKDKVYETLLHEFSIISHTVGELLATYVDNFCKFCKPRAGAEEALGKLEAMGLKMALVSNGPSPFQERNFAALGLSEYIDFILVSEAVGLRKPETGIFQLACKRLAVQSTETAFVGDNPTADIQGANAVGMFSIFVPSGRYPSCEVANAVCTDFRELPGILSAAS